MTVPVEALVSAGLIFGVGIVLLLLGIRLGMLVAPRLSRWAERDADEEQGDPDPQP